MALPKSIFKALPGVALAACFFIGTTTGFLTNDLTAGILIGLGTGLILLSIVRMIVRRRSSATDDAPPEKKG